MAGTRAAIRYAKAVLETAQEKNAADQVNADMTIIASTIKANPELSAFIANPTLGTEAKENVMLEIFGNVSAQTKNLFGLLSSNKRFESLADIATEYSRLFDEMNGVEVAKVTTAIAMDAELEAKVLAKILTFSNKKIVIENTVDPTIIGGFILRIGDQQYNASIANRLQVLKRELSN